KRLLGVAAFERNKNPLSNKYSGFEFGDSGESEKKSRMELREQTLDAQGNGKFQIDLSPVASTRSPFTARATLSLLESGGRPVVRSMGRGVWASGVVVVVGPLFAGYFAGGGRWGELVVFSTGWPG